MKKRFADAMTGAMKGWYLPTWQNEKMWAKQRSNYITNGSDKEKLAKAFPTALSFRDHCYEKVEKTDLAECDGSSDWCTGCGWDSQYDNNLTEEEKI